MRPNSCFYCHSDFDKEGSESTPANIRKIEFDKQIKVEKVNLT